MYEYRLMTGPGAICFVQELADGSHPNVAHCYTLAEARAFLDEPPFDADLATIGDGRDERQVTLDEVRAMLAEPWITYQDPARLWWDAIPDDGAGAIGSNWRPTTREDAERFIAEMTSPDAVAEGWQRSHYWGPRL